MKLTQPFVLQPAYQQELEIDLYRVKVREIVTFTVDLVSTLTGFHFIITIIKMKDTLEALQVIDPFGVIALKRSSTSPAYKQIKVSPEKRYINQRLNVSMFFSE